MRSVSTKDFVILLDALRFDYISHENTPFLHSLKNRSRRADVIETFAFQTRPAYFAGLEPEESNICHLFQYNPENSPFQFLRPYTPLLKTLHTLGIKNLGRGIIKRIARQRERSLGYAASADVLGTERIPLHLLPEFALSERLYTDDRQIFGKHPSFFDKLRAAGRSWTWIGYPRHYGSRKSILSELAKVDKTDLIYLHFSELDWLGHRHGPSSKEVQHALNAIDTTLRDILQIPLEDGGRVVVFGDHGMVQVKTQVDLQEKLNSLNLAHGKDYLVFLDSTQARFWFFQKTAERKIRSMLNTIPEGHILSDQERAKLKIRFSNRYYGDLIFMLNGGCIIHPSYFSQTGNGPAGMHGYLPNVQDNMTQLLCLGPHIPSEYIGTIPMIQIYSELLRVFELE